MRSSYYSPYEQEIGETGAFQIVNAMSSSFPLNQHLQRLPPGALSHDDDEEEDNDDDYIITLNDDGNTALNVS